MTKMSTCPHAVCWMKVLRALMTIGPLQTAALSSCSSKSTFTILPTQTNRCIVPCASQAWAIAKLVAVLMNCYLPTSMRKPIDMHFTP